MFSVPHQYRVAPGSGHLSTPHRRHLSVSQPSRSLREFNRPEEVLRAVRDAIAVHKQNYMSTGLIHNGVNVDTIRIGAPSYAPHMQGYLVPSSPNTNDATFRSVRVLSDLLQRRQIFPVDYADDLESFYYVVVWMCYAYDGMPGFRPRFIPPYNRPPLLTYLTSPPTSRESILEKEAMLFGTGIVFNKHPVSQFWGGEDMEELLDNMHYVVATRYRQKVELGRPRSIDELQSDAIQDYDAFIDIFNEALYKLERRGY